MNEILSLGNVELFLRGKSSNGSLQTTQLLTNTECIAHPDWWIELLPFLFNYYMKGSSVGSQDFSPNYPYTAVDLQKSLTEKIIPSVKRMENFDAIHTSLKDVYAALPEAKFAMNAIKTDVGCSPNSGPGAIQAIPIIPIVYGLIFLLGVSDGLRNKKK